MFHYLKTIITQLTNYNTHITYTLKPHVNVTRDIIWILAQFKTGSCSCYFLMTMQHA